MALLDLVTSFSPSVTGASSLSLHEKQVLLSQRGWLTDKIICAAQLILLPSFPNRAGLQPPTLQKVFAFQVQQVPGNWLLHGLNKVGLSSKVLLHCQNELQKGLN